MEAKQAEYFVTVRVDETRTKDYRVKARNAYSARWLFDIANPGANVILTRPAS